MKDTSYTHPYIPNAHPEIQSEMLKTIGVETLDELYGDIPDPLKFKGRMNLPVPLQSEFELRRHVEELLNKNRSCQETLSFLGAGTARHYVPAICDEINRRSEFVTAYAGEPYEDHGRFQALFEYTSMMAELLDTEVVNVPTYDWNQAASTSIRMAARITKREKVLLAENIGPDRVSTIRNYCRSLLDLDFVRVDPRTGRLDLKDLERKVTPQTACLYWENPSYFGTIESSGTQIARILKKAGALMVVGADPISLGILKPPIQYGADITCGDLQPLGIHMYQGGALGGFISTRDEERFVREFPSRLFGIAHTEVPGEWGFGDVLYNDRTSFGAREKGKEFVGTAAAMWGITAGVYLALMGPNGMRQISQTILQKSQYARKRLAGIPGVNSRFPDQPHFKEFVLDFSATGKTVTQINRELLDKGIYGGVDLSTLPGFTDCALFCVTECHSREEIDLLTNTLKRSLA